MSTALTFLGVAGYDIVGPHRRILIDPCLTGNPAAPCGPGAYLLVIGGECLLHHPVVPRSACCEDELLTMGPLPGLFLGDLGARLAGFGEPYRYGLLARRDLGLLAFSALELSLLELIHDLPYLALRLLAVFLLFLRHMENPGASG